jgi:16S rRNA (adenine1518-N6/adenine1519-N6)-dimethyltransferase
MQDHKNFVLHNQDVLGFNVSKQVKGPYKVISNIPYYLTSHLFQYFLAQENKPEVMVFLIQKEVGERVTAKPGQMSVLAVSVQLHSDPELVAQVSKKSFWPSPKVDSVVIKLTPKNKFPEVKDEKAFFRIVKVAFAAKRKQIHNNLVNGLKLPTDTVKDWLTKNKIDPTTRAQDLSMQDWVKLYKTQPKG